jgi:hypothetical protein
MYNIKEHIEINIKTRSKEISFDEWVDYNRKNGLDDEYGPNDDMINNILNQITLDSIPGGFTKSNNIDEWYDSHRSKIKEKDRYLENENLIKETFKENKSSIEKIINKNKEVDDLVKYLKNKRTNIKDN